MRSPPAILDQPVRCRPARVIAHCQDVVVEAGAAGLRREDAGLVILQGICLDRDSDRVDGDRDGKCRLAAYSGHASAAARI